MHWMWCDLLYLMQIYFCRSTDLLLYKLQVRVMQCHSTPSWFSIVLFFISSDICKLRLHVAHIMLKLRQGWKKSKTRGVLVWGDYKKHAAYGGPQHGHNNQCVGNISVVAAGHMYEKNHAWDRMTFRSSDVYFMNMCPKKRNIIKS